MSRAPGGGWHFPAANGDAGPEVFRLEDSAARATSPQDAADLGSFAAILRRDAGAWGRLVTAARQFPDEVLGAQEGLGDAAFHRWEAAGRGRKIAAAAGRPAGAAENELGLGGFALRFRHAVTHVLARELDERQIRESLREGHAYAAHDWLADPAGFTFQAGNNLGVVDMGDTIYLVGNTRIQARTPLPAKLRLLRDGTAVVERAASELDISVKEPGAYRLEARLAVAGEERPWIYTNPIYLRPPDLSLLRLPTNDLDSTVEARRDIPYVQGAPEDEPKHKLDLYLPRGKKNFPVVFFVHGGSWRFGDRAQYPPLGNRFAKAGFGFVAISYRLAPKNRHPAQIEDVADAFQWVREHIAEYGGRRDRLFLAGHSAGAHLVSLLVLDPHYLPARGLNPGMVRGVVAMSGLYEIRAFEKVFGDNPEVRRQASPLTHIRAGAPPFLILYSQWDYLLLAAQARRFYRELTSAGAPAEIAYIPGEGHISELVRMVNEGDATMERILEFLGRLSGRGANEVKAP